MKQRILGMLLLGSCGLGNIFGESLSVQEIGRRGNWRKKNEYYQEAKELLEEIDPFVETLSSMRPAFEEKEKQGKALLNAFYEKENINREDFSFIEQSLKKYFAKQERIEQERIAHEQDATEIEESPLMLRLASLQRSSEQFVRDLRELAEFESRIDSFMSTLETVIGDAGGAQALAAELTNRIASVIDHKKAQEAFDILSAKRVLVQELQDYLEGPFTTSFDALLDLLVEHIEQLSQTIESLEKEGLFLRSRPERITQEQERQARLRAELEAARARDLAARRPWYVRLWRWLTSLF